MGCKEEKQQQVIEERPPNILLVVADDAGWNDVGYHGSEIRTPVLDSLAYNGIRLERFYVAPTCSPSRAALLIGMPASRLGIVAPIDGKSKFGLPKNLTTLPKALKNLGYETALFGKWHLGLTPENGPQAYGYDKSYGFLHGQIDQYSHTYKNGDSSWHRNGKFITEEGHVTDLLTMATIGYIKKRSDSTAFFITLAYSAPHFPLQEEEKWKEPYRDQIKDSSRVDFAAAMTHMDHSFGKVMQTLKEEGLDNNTLVIFMSDNGGMENWYPKDQYNGKYGPYPVLGDNTPLRDYKTSNYEGGTRVPAFFYWKDHLEQKIRNDYVSVVDVFPTLIELAGARTMPNTIEGESFLPLLGNKAEKLAQRPIYIRGHLQESIVLAPYKLIRTRKKSGALYELFQIEEDSEEQQNLWEPGNPVAEQLLEILEKEFAKDPKTVNGPKPFE